MNYSYNNIYSICIQHGNPSFEMYGTLNHIICTCIIKLKKYNYHYIFSEEMTLFIRSNKDYDIITNTSIFIIINELLKLQDSLLYFKVKKKNECINRKIQYLMKEISKLIHFYHSYLIDYSLTEDI